MALARNVLLALFAVLFLGSAPLSAQRVYWRPDQGTLGAEKVSELQLVFEDCTPAGEVRLPEVDGLQFGTPGQTSETTIVNFEMSRRFILTYPVQPDKQQGTVVVPAFDVRTNRGNFAVGEARFTIGQAAVGGSGVSIGEITDAKLVPGRTTVWAGEVVSLDYVLAASPRFNSEIAGEPEWKPAGVLSEALGEPKQSQEIVRGQRWAAVRYSTRFIPTQPGPLVLDPIRQRVRVQTGERASFLFVQPRFEEYLVTTNRPELTVKALPQPAPEGFAGAVGTFELTSTVVPQHARLGEPITWTLKLAGTGNWPSGVGLPEREVSADFEVIQPKSRQEIEKGRLFTASIEEDAVLVPTVAGNYTIGPVRFVYFDTAAGSFRTLATDAVKVTVHPGANPPPPPSSDTEGAPSAPPAGPARSSSGAEAQPVLPPDLPPLPGVLRDPFAVQQGWSLLPRPGSPLHWLLAPLLLPALLWFILAAHAGWRDDPARQRRLARRELLRLLERLGRSSAPPDGAALEGWRIHTARMWAIERAVPTEADLTAALAAHGAGAQADTWIGLWREAEAALFAPRALLPETWTLRALAAARASRVTRARPPLPLRGRHWIPGASLLVTAVAIMPDPSAGLAASDPYVAYREGRYVEAREVWESRVGNDPADWASQNNIGLSYAQEERWPEAVAHVAAAFLLHPREPGVRANLRIALARLERVDPLLRRLVEDRAVDRAVTALAPGEWQLLERVAAIAAALGLAALVTGLYLPRWRRRLHVAGWGSVALGTLLLAAAWAALRHYGPLADPAVALVVQPTELRSIPSELTERQQAAPIPPATVVLLGRDFLGWRQVRSGGASPTSGWVRQEAIKPLFRPRQGSAENALAAVRQPDTI